jgi:hypothetical protein
MGAWSSEQIRDAVTNQIKMTWAPAGQSQTPLLLVEDWYIYDDKRANSAGLDLANHYAATRI